MNVKVRYLKEFAADVNAYPEHDKSCIRAAIIKIRENPLKRSEGGVGKAACEHGNESLLSVKIAATDIRIVYKLIKSKDGESALVIFASVVSDSTPRVM